MTVPPQKKRKRKKRVGMGLVVKTPSPTPVASCLSCLTWFPDYLLYMLIYIILYFIDKYKERFYIL